MSIDLIKTSKFPLFQKDSYKLGFECEFLYQNRNKIDDVYYAVRQNFLAIHPQMDTTSDPSVRSGGDDPYAYSIEVRTPPLPPQESLEVLYKTFDYISKHGYTNKTCGLHCNFSPNDDKVYESLNPLPIVMDGIWDKIKSDFHRTEEQYCVKSLVRAAGSPLKFWNGLMRRTLEFYDSHSTEVNFINYGEKRYPASRIEMRCFGSKDYHTRFETILSYLHQVIKLFRRNYAVKF